MLTWFVEDSIGFHHVIHNIRLGDLFGSEAHWTGQIFAVVVAKMVVGYNRGRFQPSTHQEIHEHGFHFGLATLEVISAYHSVVLLGKFDHSWNKCVLRGAI